MNEQPTVVLHIGDSAIAYDENGEIIETVEFSIDGVPDWRNAGCCDPRGSGGRLGLRALKKALDAGEENARYCGLGIRRVTW